MTRRPHVITVEEFRYHEIEHLLAADSDDHKALHFHWMDGKCWYTVRRGVNDVFETRVLEVAIAHYNDI